MTLREVKLGGVSVSRLIIGNNPFSGFSHQGAQRDAAMRRYYTAANIKDALKRAEDAGITTWFARADAHVMRLYEEYRNEGGRLQWIAQTAPEMADFAANIRTAVGWGAVGAYLHGGQVDLFHHKERYADLAKSLETCRECKIPGGFAAHRCQAQEWIRDHLQPDFHMVSYYDPTPRLESAAHVVSDHEKFDPAQRDRVAQLIPTLKAPAVHYKVLAAGRTPPEEAFAYVAKVIRPQDAVLVGFYLGDDKDLIAKTVKLFERIVG